MQISCSRPSFIRQSSIPLTSIDDIPDEILQACFARLPLKYLARLQAVSKRWLRLSHPESLYLLRKSMALTQPCAYLLTSKYEHGRYAGLQITGGELITKINDTNPNSYINNHDDLINLRSVTLLQGPPRLQYAATAAADGRLLYVLGGRAPLMSGRLDRWVVFNRVDVYDTVINRWMKAMPMQEARYAFAVGAFTRGADGRACLVVAGGYDAHGHALASAELYDGVCDEWKSLPCMNSLSGACKGEFTRGKFYVKMANNGPLAVEAFDPCRLCWGSPFCSPHRDSPHLDSACSLNHNLECVSTQTLRAFDTSPGPIVFEL